MAGQRAEVNLHAIVAPAISTINPPTLCMVQISAGYNTQPDGTRTPNYMPAVSAAVDVQALSYTDLMKLGGLNLEGTRRKAYLNGNIEGLDRAAIKGGDLFIMPNLPDFPGPTTWLVATVLEHWPGWTCVALTLQLPQ